MSAGDFSRYDNMKMLLHHIYEFRKGVRDLVLCTLCPTCAGLLIERLRSQGIDYLLQPVTEQKVNLYFGKFFRNTENSNTKKENARTIQNGKCGHFLFVRSCLELD